jgi:hypothetical protein
MSDWAFDYSTSARLIEKVQGRRRAIGFVHGCVERCLEDAKFCPKSRGDRLGLPFAKLLLPFGNLHNQLTRPISNLWNDMGGCPLRILRSFDKLTGCYYPVWHRSPEQRYLFLNLIVIVR